jgi:hypothetical protein
MHDEIDTAFAASHRRAMGSSLTLRDRLPWRAITAALLALCLVGAGIGGYLIGNSPEVDLDAVRSTAAAKGQKEGSQAGTKEGYAQGFRAARKRTYGSAYSTAYKQAYVAEFESAGLDPPEQISVPGPR